MSRRILSAIAIVTLTLGVSLTACDDGETNPATDTSSTADTDTGSSTCDTQANLASIQADYFEKSCNFGSCHAAGANPAGGLDLQTDPIAAMVGVAAVAAPAKQLIVAGDADASFLVQKLDGTQGSTEGSLMPLGALEPVEPCRIDAVRAWINAGANP